MAGGQRKQSSHIKTRVRKRVEAVGYPGGTQTDCPRMHDWRRGVGKPQLSWSRNWEGYEDQSTSFYTQPSAKGRLREMWAHPTKEQGKLITSAFSVFLFFPVTFCRYLSLWAKWQSLRKQRVTYSGERSRLMAVRVNGTTPGLIDQAGCTREADRGHY